jgi:hypothetical protein
MSASYLNTSATLIGGSYRATDTLDDPNAFWIWTLGVNFALNEVMPLIVQVGGTTVFSGQVFDAAPYGPPPLLYHIAIQIKENKAVFPGGLDTGDFVVESARVGSFPPGLGQWGNDVSEIAYPDQCVNLNACVFAIGGPVWSFLPESTVLAEPHMLFNIEAVPEPATLTLVLAGVAAVLALRRRLV